ncbi:hypothetical protein ACFXK0_16420 [Nocardia sp. NPDC059177]|uniref:hypothetical protein n=1 Tax=Nocardia sp. NPDC059177 TaxID=3346759 RepID=UPI0036C92984
MGRRKRPGYREQRARNARFFGGRRKWVWIGALGAVVVGLAGTMIIGIVQSDTRRPEVGDCGFFVEGHRNATVFEHRPCDHPEAVVIVTKVRSTEPCVLEDHEFSTSGKSKTNSKRKYLCTHLHAAVGECVNDPGNVNFHLKWLRKVPCGAGTFVVDTRVDAHDPSVCTASAKKYTVTEKVTHRVPPVSYCLHRI